VLWAEHVAKNTARDRDDVAAEVKTHFSDAEFVELTAVCGLFGQSNRFQDSMRLPIEEQHEVDKIKTSVRADPARLKAYLERILEHWPREFPKMPAVEPAAGANAAPAGDARSCRVPLLDAGTAGADGARFIAAASALLGRTTNAVKVWAHTPHVAKMFVPFFFAFERDGAGSILPAPLRLMVLLTTHHMHAAQYMIAHHTVLGRAAGLSDAQLAALARADTSGAAQFSTRERAAIAWAALVAPNTAKRDEAAFIELKKYFNDAEVVEMTALCAIASNADLIYNALRVPLEPVAELAALYPAVAADPARLQHYLGQVVADWPSEFPQIDAGPR
jgi:alkylhydroperoxidase family enzyme